GTQPSWGPLISPRKRQSVPCRNTLANRKSVSTWLLVLFQEHCQAVLDISLICLHERIQVHPGSAAHQATRIRIEKLRRNKNDFHHDQSCNNRSNPYRTGGIVPRMEPAAQ